MAVNGHSDEWGWEPLESEDEVGTITVASTEAPGQLMPEDFHQHNESKKADEPSGKEATHVSNSSKNTSYQKNHLSDSSKNNAHAGNLTMKKGITSSPSFQELEKAIGATLEMSLGGSSDDLTDSSKGNMVANSNQMINSLTHHKLQQQRFRQKQQYQQYQSPLQLSSATSYHQNTRSELNIFTNESESRAIILFHSPTINASVIRDSCQKFGVLYYIRPEFHSKGVTLLCYFDLRCAIRAKTSLPEELGEEAEATANYSIQLHASNSSSEEFRLIVHHIPENHSESDVEAIFSRYGQLRTFEKNSIDIEKPLEPKEDGVSPEKSEIIKNDDLSFMVEFYNIQDARLAASELSASSNQIWGEHTTITFASLDGRKQQLCRILLTTLSKWRTELASLTYPVSPISPRYLQQWQPQMYQNNTIHQVNNPSTTSNVLVHPNFVPNQVSMMYTYPVQTQQVYQQQQQQPSAYMSIQSNQGEHHQINSINHMQSQQQQAIHVNYDNKSNDFNDSAQNFELREYALRQNQNYQPYQQQLVRGQQQQQPLIMQTQSQRPQPNQYRSNQSTQMGKYQNPPTYNNAVINSPQTMYPVPPEVRPHHHNGGHGHAGRVRSSYPRTGMNNGPGNNGMSFQGNNNQNNASPDVNPSIDSEFSIDFDSLLDGSEFRTTVMVRNIPNKYNQVMLLDEVNINHQWTYDFFYLPIDFKNRCNVGYCFINFLEPKFILPFIREFNGQRWKSFNSEKVCVISFARIQGKAAMVSRFQNSSLLEKDDEYQPLLFYSSGELKGQPEPFPSNNRTRQQHHQQHSNHGNGYQDS